MNEIAEINTKPIYGKLVETVSSGHGLAGLAGTASPLILSTFGVLTFGWAVSLAIPVGVGVFAAMVLVFGWPQTNEEVDWIENGIKSDKLSLEKSIEINRVGLSWIKGSEAVEKFPTEIRKKITNLYGALGRILSQIEREEESNIAINFEIFRISTKHVPMALKAYMEVPKHMTQRLKNVDGKTANDLINKSMDDLLCEVERIENAINEKNFENLNTEAKFLSDKYDKTRS